MMSDATQPPAPARIPPLSLLFGYGPVLLLPLLALLGYLLPLTSAWIPVAAAQLWGAVILIFLAGVRRGLSFFTADGPRPIQIVTMVWLFLLGLAGLALPPQFAFPALTVGYGSVALLDPPAARRGEVPQHFARLRPPQMGIAIVSFVALMVRVYMA